jgi:AAA domain-containing protein
MRPLPISPAWRLAERDPELRWLVTHLWSQDAVGIVGGEPKCCKSFLALDLAVAVAAGVPCLRRFAVPVPGRVLLYAAEDAHPIVRRRLEGIAIAAGVDLCDLDIQVITAPTLRLDLPADRLALQEAVASLQPKLLILDPFVRLHRIDENASGEVAPLLAYLRELQRRYALAVLVVHHAKKGAGNVRAGQALRGSSEFHAWGDSNLYLRRDGDSLTLAVEHRAAPALKPMKVELVASGEALACGSSSTAVQNHRRRPRWTSASPPYSPPPLHRFPSPSSGPNVACVPPRSTSALPGSPLAAVLSGAATAATAWSAEHLSLRRR